MNYPFNIEFVIFDENKEVSVSQKETRKQLIRENLRYITKKAFNDDIHYNFLDRVEASVSSNDKQLRLSIDTLHIESKKYQHSIHFNQNHSSSKEYFTMEELKHISSKIKIGLEDFLHYEIDEPIFYIKMDEL
jgi:hypothetical protein